MKRDNRIRMYKIGCLLFAAFLFLLPQRTLPYSDVRVLATVLGVDAEDGQVTVSAQLSVPVASGSNGKASTVASASGGSLGEALENMEIGIGQRIDYGHLGTIALGKDMDFTSAKDTVSYMLASGRVAACAFLVFCPSSSASDFIAQAQTLGESSDAELGRYIRYFKNANHVSAVSVLQFVQSLSAASHTIFVPCVRLEKDSEQSGGQSRQQSGSGGQSDSGGDQSGSGGGGGQGGEQKKMVAADTVAIYGGGGNAPVVLDERTTRGIVWQDEDSRFGLVELKNITLDGQTEASVAARLTSKKVKTKLSCKNGNTCAYTIKVKLRLESTQVLGLQAKQGERKKALEQAFEHMIEESVLYAATVSKERNIDFLELRSRFHRYCTKGFKSFDLGSTEVTVKAKVTLVA